MTTLFNRVAVLASGALLAACASVPKMDLPSPDRDPVAQATTAWPQGDGAWPTADWWTGFDDPALSALIRQVLAANPSLAAARSHAAAATAVAEGQRSTLAPQVGMKLAPGREQISANGMFPKPFGGQTFTLVDLAGSLNYRLDLSGSLRAQVRSRDAQAAAAAEDARRAAEAVAATTARVYYELSAALADREDLARMQQLIARNRQIAEVRANLGLDTQALTRHTVADAEAFRAQLAAADERIARARGVIAALSGTGPDAMATLTPPRLRSVTPAHLPKDLHLSLLSRRADVRAARDRVESVAYDRLAAQRAYLPDLNFQFLLGLQSRALDSLFESGSRQWTVGPALTLPLFDGGQRRAANRAEQALYDAARAQYQQTVVQAVSDVNTALVSRKGSAEALQAAQKALDEESASLAALQRRYAVGIAAEPEFVQAQMRVLERTREVSRQLVRSRWADIDLIESLGGDAQEETTR